jgi:hypothetical protein
MKLGFARQVALMVAVPFLLSAGLAMAEEVKQPSGTITIEEEQVMFLIGGDFGGGTLEYNGKSYPFKLNGLKLSGFGMHKVKLEGDVYDLNDVADFPGEYVAASAGIVVGEAEAGDLWMENDKGVKLHLKGKKAKGLVVELGPAAVTITMD